MNQNKFEIKRFTENYFFSKKGFFEIDLLIGYLIALGNAFEESGQIESPEACEEFMKYYVASIDRVQKKITDAKSFYLGILGYFRVLPDVIGILEKIAAKHGDICDSDLIERAKKSLEICRAKEKELLSYDFNCQDGDKEKGETI